MGDDDLWAAYTADRSRANRNALVMHHLTLVERVLRRVKGGEPQRKEIRSHAVEGLIRAIETWRPDGGATFHTWACMLISTSIADGWRQFDRVPRWLREGQTKYRAKWEELAQRRGTEPSDAVVFGELDLTDKHRRLIEQAQGMLESPWELMIHEFPDPDPLPGDRLMAQAVDEIVAAAVSTLPERHKIVVTLYYFEGMLMRTIGTVLGVSEGRVSQIHSQALNLLRDRVEDALL